MASSRGGRAHRVVGGQGLGVEHVDARAGDTALVQGGEQGVLVDDRGARGVDQVGGGLEEREFGGAEQAAGAVAEDQVDRDEVAARQQLLLGGRELDAHLVGVLLGEVVAPGADVHAEGEAHVGDPAADLAEAEQAEPAAVQIRAHRLLPGPAGAQGVVLLDDAAGQAQEQGPGQFDGRGRDARRAAHGDAVRLGGGVVDDAVAHPGGDEQLQPGQAGEQGGGEGDAFAQGDDDVEAVEGRGEFVVRTEVIAEGDGLDPVGHRRPVGEFGRHLLEVVEHGAAQHGGSLLRCVRSCVCPVRSVMIPHGRGAGFPDT
ncbi:hypothetical protein HMPREF1211_05170 [Streptomyces sp. HGB0020]|nr:hypothetical protein HMPREF1211_05170 [Streptomyces sp. HGB0020]